MFINFVIYKPQIYESNLLRTFLLLWVSRNKWFKMDLLNLLCYKYYGKSFAGYQQKHNEVNISK